MFKKLVTRKKPAAQAMAEFALVLPILLMVVYGLLEVGRLLFIFATVNTASRQAVRYGSAIGQVDTDNNGTLDTPRYLDCNGILAAANNVAFITSFTNVNITYDRGVDSSGNPIKITSPISFGTNPNPNPDPDDTDQDGASPNTCTLAAALSQDPIQNGDRVSVYVSAFFAPVIPLIPLDPIQIESSASRTIVGEISIEVTAVPAAWGGAGGGTNSLDLSITASPETYDTLGQIITYTYTLGNSGSNNLNYPYSISDDTVATIDCSGAASPLTPGASTTCTGTYAITQFDLDHGSLTNTATATAGATTSQPASATIIATQNPQLNLEKTSSPIIAFNQGQSVTYTYTLENTGNVTLNAPFSITDDVIPSVNCSGVASSIAPGSSTTCTASHTITNADINAGFVTNYAIASCSQAVSNLASATVITKPLVLSVSASPDTATAIGQVITYTYTLTNAGPANLTSPYSITDDIVTSTDCSSATSPLAPGASTTCTGTYTITQADADAGSVNNHATATARYSGQQVTSNQASTSVLVIGAPKIRLSISATPNPATTLGTVVNYTYTITNTGSLSLTAPYTITDDKYTTLVDCSGATSPLAPGASTTCTHSHTITQNDLDDGSIINTATVTGNAGANLVTSNPVYATVITHEPPRLTLEKTANPTTATTIGQTITYTYKLRNTGGTVLSEPYDVQDNKTNVNCTGAASTIPIGGFVNCTATYNITAGDAGAGSVNNQAIATAKYNTQTIHSKAQATVTVNTALACDPRHSVLKTNPFGFTIYNYGTSTITVSEVQIYWNDSPSSQRLDVLTFGGITIWNDTDNTPPTIITSFNGDVSITPGSSKLLEVDFRRSYNTNGSERILVTFAQGGCPVLDSDNSGQLP
jgi:uncharacterized repeat protein (TIGR01451 family)